MKALYLDRQEDYEKNLEIYLSESSTDLEKKKAYDNIFIDFKTYCFNKIRRMKSFLPVSIVDDWAVEVTLNALTAIKNKGLNIKESWPTNMGGYLSWFTLAINNKEKFNPEKNEVSIEMVEKEEEETFMEVENVGNVSTDTGEFLVKEAVKMTVYNYGYSMVDVDRAIKLFTKYNGKIGKFSQKNVDIINALKRNVEMILNGNVKVEGDENE